MLGFSLSALQGVRGRLEKLVVDRQSIADLSERIAQEFQPERIILRERYDIEPNDKDE
ncbi:MAG: hypothetical protein HY691_07640 [Chloroflexi bacterium]|nr:hypothetical protein [Chloroflexota bacterium]